MEGKGTPTRARIRYSEPFNINAPKTQGYVNYRPLCKERQRLSATNSKGTLIVSVFTVMTIDCPPHNPRCIWHMENYSLFFFLLSLTGCFRLSWHELLGIMVTIVKNVKLSLVFSVFPNGKLIFSTSPWGRSALLAPFNKLEH